MAPRSKAYSYVRFSTKRQGKGDSLQRQLDRSRQYAAEHDLELQEQSFEDLGVSAFDRSNVTKGALAAFIQAAESGVIERGSYLLVENLDRLSRADLVDGISLLDRLVKLPAPDSSGRANVRSEGG
jgi:DNA invertase Pin-like site-specific DNA recombinase